MGETDGNAEPAAAVGDSAEGEIELGGELPLPRRSPV
jgi:hypothetical protein